MATSSHIKRDNSNEIADILRVLRLLSWLFSITERCRGKTKEKTGYHVNEHVALCRATVGLRVASGPGNTLNSVPIAPVIHSFDSVTNTLVFLTIFWFMVDRLILYQHLYSGTAFTGFFSYHARCCIVLQDNSASHATSSTSARKIQRNTPTHLSVMGWQILHSREICFKHRRRLLFYAAILSCCEIFLMPSVLCVLSLSIV